MTNGENPLYNKTMEPLWAKFQKVERIDYLANTSVEHLRLIVGPKTAQSIFDWFREPRNIQLIADFKEIGLNMS